MFYLKSKLYFLILFGVWLYLMYLFLGLLLGATPLGSVILISMPVTPEKAADQIYWFAPIWFVVFIFWQFAPKNEKKSMGGKMSRKQKKLVQEAINDPATFMNK